MITIFYFYQNDAHKLCDKIKVVSRYRERMSMPKIVISATGDEFFQPDDSYNWFNEMPGQTYVRLLPNSEHGMIPPQALSSPSIIHTISFGFLDH